MTESDLPYIPIDDYAELIEDYRVCRDTITDWKDRQKSVSSDIKKVLGDRYSRGTIGGIIVATYAGYPKSTVDADWLKHCYPEIWHQSLRTSTVSRLTVTK
jgi:hypothetical protein